jgi:hypothetical protein
MSKSRRKNLKQLLLIPAPGRKRRSAEFIPEKPKWQWNKIHSDGQQAYP